MQNHPNPDTQPDTVPRPSRAKRRVLTASAVVLLLGFVSMNLPEPNLTDTHAFMATAATAAGMTVLHTINQPFLTRTAATPPPAKLPATVQRNSGPGTAPQAVAPNTDAQRQALVRAQIEMQARQAAWMREQANQMAQLNAQRQQMELQARAAANRAAYFNTQRQQAEMQAQAAGRQGAQHAQRNYNNHSGGYLGSLGL